MIMTQRTIRAWSFIHKWSSLICTLFMLMLCITGLPLIFHEEIEHAFEPELAAVIPGTPKPTLDSIVTSAISARPGEVAAYLFFEPGEPRVMVASAPSVTAVPDDFFYQVFDSRNGHKIDLPQPNEGVMHFIFKLHVDMFAGLPGMLFLGFMGLLLIVAIVSGVVLYAPFMRKLEFGTVRSERGNRARWLDLHNLLGIVTLVWLFVVGFTGSINTLGQPIEGIWQVTQLAEMAASHKNAPIPTQLASIDIATASVEKAAPDKKIRTVAFPGTPFASPHHYGVYLIGDTALTSRLLTPALVDAATGEISALREMPLYVKALFVSQPLHFGDYGGLPLKIIWTVLDITSIVVLVSGLYLWLKLKPKHEVKNTKVSERIALLDEVIS